MKPRFSYREYLDELRLGFLRKAMELTRQPQLQTADRFNVLKPSFIELYQLYLMGVMAKRPVIIGEALARHLYGDEDAQLVLLKRPRGRLGYSVVFDERRWQERQGIPFEVIAFVGPLFACLEFYDAP
jgi:hypothetical protein